MKDNFIIKSDCIEINIFKPVYGNFVYIRDKYIKIAKNKNIPLRITVPNGKADMTAEEWMKNAQKIEKEFKIPGSPMILWGNHVIIK